MKQERTLSLYPLFLGFGAPCSWLAAYPVPVGMTLTSQKLILAKISNKRLFLRMEVVGSYLWVGS